MPHSLLSSQFCYQGLTLQTEKKRKGLKGAFAKAQEDRIYNREAPRSDAVVLKFFLPDQNPSINKSCKIEYGQSLRYLTWVDQVPKIGKNLCKTKIDLVRPTDIQHTPTYPNIASLGKSIGYTYRISLEERFLLVCISIVFA